MRSVDVFVGQSLAGRLEQSDDGRTYVFRYEPAYLGAPVSLAMPVSGREFTFNDFPPFFDGLLPEGPQLEALLLRAKLDAGDRMGQLLAVGEDVVGNVSVKPGT